MPTTDGFYVQPAKRGRPKGYKTPRIIERNLVKRHFEQRVLRATDGLIDAQLSLAQGQQFLFKIEKEEIIGPKGGVSYKAKKPELVTKPAEIQAYLEGVIEHGDIDDQSDSAATYYYITTKEPSNQAIDSLHNRVHGKPTESLQLGGDVAFSLISLAEGRKKLEERLAAEAIQGTVRDITPEADPNTAPADNNPPDEA